jgi:hypothetical protein
VLGALPITEARAALKMTPWVVLFDFEKNEWIRRVIATAYYRVGDWKESIRRHTTELKKNPADAPVNVLSWLVLAMAHHRAGEAEAARKYLDRATRWIDQAVANWPKESLAPGGLALHDWVECQVLRREAERVMTGKR